MSKYDEAYEAVVHMAKLKMLMNAHKGNIEEQDPIVIIDSAKEELDELKQAIESGNYLNIIEEIADVLNFAVGAAHNALTGYRGRKNGNAEDPRHITRQ